MTGLERNSDVIVMASYAPLLVRVDPGGMQWETDLIGYTAEKSYGSPAYYAQVLFGSYLQGEFLIDAQGRPIANDFVNVFAAGQLALTAVLTVACVGGLLPRFASLAFAPLLFRGWFYFIQKPAPLAVRKLGWSELAQAIAFSVLLIGTFSIPN